LDEAVLRPGRQRFFREFEMLPWDSATALAEKLGVQLSDMREYSLAELYYFKDVQNQDRLNKQDQRVIGFAQP
jgi:Mn-dependent DtxR family transcriptional regulator